mmetsp:Transcript_91443/g.263271  ORF Transcript_91443/g.263271 Transcript_91443/m.263271 type:complete len:221 (-) Transcript_91443:127-789(-)
MALFVVEGCVIAGGFLLQTISVLVTLDVRAKGQLLHRLAHEFVRSVEFHAVFVGADPSVRIVVGCHGVHLATRGRPTVWLPLGQAARLGGLFEQVQLQALEEFLSVCIERQKEPGFLQGRRRHAMRRPAAEGLGRVQVRRGVQDTEPPALQNGMDLLAHLAILARGLGVFPRSAAVWHIMVGYTNIHVGIVRDAVVVTGLAALAVVVLPLLLAGHFLHRQ